MTGLAHLLVTLLLAGGPEKPPPPTPPQLKEHESAVPACPKEVATCIGVRLFVVVTNGKAVVTPEWVAGQLERANALLGPVGLALQLHSVQALPPKFAHVRSRADRDQLGAKRWEKGYINVFVAGIVDDVDEKGQIYGVHWRWRENKSRRWIILSGEAWPMTLAHELGHFFGLAHNALIGSIMNKAGNDLTPIKERVFLEGELETVKLGLAAKLKAKELLPQAPTLPPLPEP